MRVQLIRREPNIAGLWTVEFGVRRISFSNGSVGFAFGERIDTCAAGFGRDTQNNRPEAGATKEFEIRIKPRSLIRNFFATP